MYCTLVTRLELFAGDQSRLRPEPESYRTYLKCTILGALISRGTDSLGLVLGHLHNLDVRREK